ncbi:sensor histidine kinase [Virgibacillus salinus]|uniref:histidine kinase n=1 Tax=Virgibacillus salinus TaxID=553311 RepID=A0A1H0ZFZ9_9BACI|nr:HAMP domain-containing sensor histidine kinase [Virgibacillus salinus]SDQ26314.1 Signal transduction histidine kinase [Virgibacillus salinus]
MTNRKSYLFIGCLGLLLVTYGEILPPFLDNWSLFIVDSINESIIKPDSGLLLITSFAYIARYLLVFFLIYFGSMLIAHALSKDLESMSFSVTYIGVILLTLSLYSQFYLEHFSYLGHIFSIGIIVLLQLYIPKHKHFHFIFSIILFLVLLAVQWLHLIPALTEFGFGANDIAASIKIADNFLTGNSLFNTIATIFFIAFLTIAIIFTFLIHLVNKQTHTLKKYQVQEEELKETRTALVESKVYEEINMLVHDLKTPLVTVEGLISLITMKMQPVDGSALHNYFTRMDHSVEKMKDMITEILYENIKQKLPVKELLEYVTSHLSLDEQLVHMEVEIEDNLPAIQVNKIRFSRAISNILENAISSFEGKKGFIHINVKSIDNGILFQIQDNGPGIKEEHINDIWLDGFSTKNSSGIGLSFVKRVVENHSGTITVKSIRGSHTQMNITLPTLKVGDEIDEHYHINS